MGIYIDGIDLQKSTYIELRIEQGGNIARPFGHGYVIDPDAVAVEVAKGGDTISRKAAIDALTKDKKELEHIINGMSGHEKEFDRFVGQRNQIDCDIYAIEQLPPANNSEIPNSSDTISRAKAIEAIDEIESEIAEGFGFEYEKWRKYFCDLPPAQLGTNLAEVGTDTISRQAAKDMIKNHKSDFSTEKDYRTARACVNAVPPAQPERIKGRWIEAESQCGIKCSNCGYPVDDFCHSIDYIDLDYAPNFCPNCGADMREVADGNHN